MGNSRKLAMFNLNYVITNYYHGIHILKQSLTSTEHKGPNPDTTALVWL